MDKKEATRERVKRYRERLKQGVTQAKDVTPDVSPEAKRYIEAGEHVTPTVTPLEKERGPLPSAEWLMSRGVDPSAAKAIIAARREVEKYDV